MDLRSLVPLTTAACALGLLAASCALLGLDATGGDGGAVSCACNDCVETSCPDGAPAVCGATTAGTACAGGPCETYRACMDTCEGDCACQGCGCTDRECAGKCVLLCLALASSECHSALTSYGECIATTCAASCSLGTGGTGGIGEPCSVLAGCCPGLVEPQQQSACETTVASGDTSECLATYGLYQGAGLCP